MIIREVLWVWGMEGVGEERWSWDEGQKPWYSGMELSGSVDGREGVRMQDGWQGNDELAIATIDMNT